VKNLTEILEVLLVLAVVVIGGGLGAFLFSRMIRKGGPGSMTSVISGATDELLTMERKKAAEVIVDENAGKRFGVQTSGEPETPGEKKP
jgi:uncharacterized protein (UPF0333 family)